MDDETLGPERGLPRFGFAPDAPMPVRRWPLQGLMRNRIGLATLLIAVLLTSTSIGVVAAQQHAQRAQQAHNLHGAALYETGTKACPVVVLPAGLLADEAYRVATADLASAATADGYRCAHATMATDTFKPVAGSVLVSALAPSSKQAISMANMTLTTPNVPDDAFAASGALAATEGVAAGTTTSATPTTTHSATTHATSTPTASPAPTATGTAPAAPSPLLQLTNAPEDSYALWGTTYQGVPVTVVAGVGVRGPLFGLFRLAQMARTDPTTLEHLAPVTETPALPLRLVGFPAADLATYRAHALDAIRFGYNAILVETWTSVATYKTLDARIYDEAHPGPDTQWLAQQRQRISDELAIAHTLHLMTISPGDVVSVPRSVIKLFGAQLGANPGQQLPPETYDNKVAVSPATLCYTKPLVQTLLTTALHEVLHDYPDITGVMVRTGENYIQGPLIGSSPVGGSCPVKTPALAADRLAATIQQIDDEVVGQNHRIYIQRAWDLGPNGFHSDPAYAAEVYADLASRHVAQTGLVMSFKQTQADFWRYSEFNPNIKPGPYTQIMEMQAQREYEGKGAFPNFLGAVFAQGTPEVKPAGGVAYARAQGVRGIWAWDGGGGWRGPVPRLTLWVQANTYAVARLAWDPDIKPAQLAHDWAALTFGPAAADPISDLLLRSPTVVLDTYYIGPWAHSRGDWGDVVNFRDDELYGGPRLLASATWVAQNGATDAAIQEKRDARTQLDAMLADEQQALPLIADSQLHGFLSDSMTYERLLIGVMSDYVEGVLHYARWHAAFASNASPHPLTASATPNDDRQQASMLLTQARGEFTTYTDSVAQLHDGATPYLDNGFSSFVSQMLTTLGT